ncbi:hypothetical protein Tco_0563821 [Tanacetum coccineum]
MAESSSQKTSSPILEPPFTDHMKAICNLDVHVDSKAPKPSLQTEEAKDKSPSHPSPPTLVVGEIHKEAQQAAGGPTSLGVTIEEGAHPQLSSAVCEDFGNCFSISYAFSDSLLLTPLCCDDIHDVTPRVSALAGCDTYQRDEDLTDEDGDIGMGDSTGVSASLGGEIFSGGKNCQEIKHW